MLGCRPLLPTATGRSAPIPSSTTVRRKAKATRGAATPKDKTAAATAKPAQARQLVPSIGGSQARGAQAPPARDQRPRAAPARCSAGTRPPTCRKGGAAARARQGATLEPAGAREVHRSGARQAARRPRALCRAPALRLRRCEPGPRRAARLREGDQGAGRVRRPLERASAPPPTTPGRARARPTTSRPCVRCSRRRSTSAANMPTSSRPTSTSPTR